MTPFRTTRIWQHQMVLPYILHELKSTIETITQVDSIYLFGSRAKTPFEAWDQLTGSDWDILVGAGFPILNTQIWTRERNYHIDLLVRSQKEVEARIQRGTFVMLFPRMELSVNYKP